MSLQKTKLNYVHVFGGSASPGDVEEMCNVLKTAESEWKDFGEAVADDSCNSENKGNALCLFIASRRVDRNFQLSSSVSPSTLDLHIIKSIHPIFLFNLIPNL
ncbi:hypothetical protein L1887_40278 [Cichorium endivia]|nr:hypothetical protein L1887_40278 [Cichorium endivia]